MKANPEPISVAVRVAFVVFVSSTYLPEMKATTPAKQIIMPTISIRVTLILWMMLASIVVMNGLVEKITDYIETGIYFKHDSRHEYAITGANTLIAIVTTQNWAPFTSETKF